MLTSEIAYASGTIIILLALTNYAGKCFDKESKTLGIILMVLILLFFFGAFGFAKLLFGF